MLMMADQKSKLAYLILQLSLIEEVGPATIGHLLEKIGADNLLSLHQFKLLDLQKLGFSPKKAQLILAGLRDTKSLEQELSLIAKHRVNWITILDSAYPENLKQISGAPAVLYWQGDLLNLLKRSLAVVGARKANNYAKTVIDQIVPELVLAGYTIVSGGALGVDAMAHRATLQAGGKTIVVCGTGLVHSYPAVHKKLYEQIIASGGAVVSCFNMATTGMPGNFPARNRIISGLSQGCLVVQAASSSGAKITAQFALEQGRELFVVPGLFGDELSAGCHELAQQGAKVIHTCEDIFIELQPERKAFTHKPVVVSTNLLKSACSLDDLIINLCSRQISIDDLQVELNLSIVAVQDRLFDLQLQGRVKQNFAGLWEIG